MPETSNGGSDPLAPSAALLCKLGSILVHLEEWLDPIESNVLDLKAAEGLLADPEVLEWLAAMGEMALLPVKR